jgi:hypothetical protein
VLVGLRWVALVCVAFVLVCLVIGVFGLVGSGVGWVALGCVGLRWLFGLGRLFG